MKFVGALCTRYQGIVAGTCSTLAGATFEEWGRLQIFADGDVIRASAFSDSANHGAERDATFVRVHVMVLPSLL